MPALNELRKHLKQGKVYRRAELVEWSNAVDRHVAQLLEQGLLKKLSQGLYYVPKQTIFGTTPPEEEALVGSFLKDDHFLLMSPNAYNSLGVGTTQLYNKMVVYNHKRHGEFKLGGRNFFFHAKHRFPKKVTEEFLLVDLLNNLEALADDKYEVLKNVTFKVPTMDTKKLQHCVHEYGSSKTKKLLSPLLTTANGK